MMPWLIFIVLQVFAGEIQNIPQVGPHYRILTLDKSENPQNLLAIYTRLNSDCSLREDDGVSPLGFYWLMDGARYKRVHPLILKNVNSRIHLDKKEGRFGFAIALEDLQNLDADLAGHPIEVRTAENHGSCRVEADLKLGPSDRNMGIRLTGIHSESRKTFWPPFRKLVSITLSGENLETGEPVKRTYRAR